MISHIYKWLCSDSKNDKDRRILTGVVALSIYFIAHSYRFFSNGFAGDSLLMIYQNDAAWQIALGRFIHPFLLMIRGAWVTPLLVCLLSALFLSLSAICTVDYLGFHSRASVILLSGIMATNFSLTVTNATFLHVSDFYMLSLFFAVLSVSLFRKNSIAGYITGILSLIVSLGIYQSFVCFAIGLFMIRFLLSDRNKKEIIFTFLSFAIAGLLYVIAFKTFQHTFGIWNADTYNGLANMGSFSFAGIPALIADTYRRVADFFINPAVFATIGFRNTSLTIVWIYVLRISCLIVLTWTLYLFIRRNIIVKDKSVVNKILSVAALILFPLGINIVNVASQGMEHSIMIYAFCLIYILPLAFKESMDIGINKKAFISVFCALIIVIWNNTVFSNQLYFKRELQDRAALSLMTRIVSAVESTDGYVAGVTPVSFCGSFEDSPYCTEMTDMASLTVYGVGKTVTSYQGTDYAYLKYNLNIDMNLTRIPGSDERIINMPTYPNEGSISFIDDILVVKISD